MAQVKTGAWIVATQPHPEKAAMEKFFLDEECADELVEQLNKIATDWGREGKWRKFRVLLEVL